MLQVDALHTYYGLSHVLQGVSLRVGAGELVALIGRNGAGKSTTLKTIFGITPARSGQVVFEGQDITHFRTHQIPLLGMCYVPEERRIFPGLSVYENLRLALLPHKKRLDLSAEIERVFGLFPRLRERSKQIGKSLSGGEQQMLAMARGLVSKPRMMLVDEPTQGLAPAYVRSVADIITQIRATGVGVLLVEQNAEIALSISDRAYVIDHGVIQFEGPSPVVRDRDDIRSEYLSL